MRFIRRIAIVLCIEFLVHAIPVTAQAPPSAGEIVFKVRDNVLQAWNSLPDFVCREKITSRRIEKGKIKEERLIETVFTAVRRTDVRATTSMNYTMNESREITAIDGKAAGKGAKMPKAPLLANGIAANVLFMTFVLVDSHDYQAKGNETIDGVSARRIEFVTRPGQKFLTGTMADSSGYALIDLQAMQPLRVARNFGSDSTFPVSADFQRIEIDGKPYWVPRLVKAESVLGKNGTGTYMAEYGDCRKFEVSVQIKAFD